MEPDKQIFQWRSRALNYGKAIRVVRTARGYTQQQLAEKIQRDASYISMIETGRRLPSLLVLEDIAKALSMPLYLMLLLGSGSNDLRGASPESAQQLGTLLLEIVGDSQTELHQ